MPLAPTTRLRPLSLIVAVALLSVAATSCLEQTTRPDPHWVWRNSGGQRSARIEVLRLPRFLNGRTCWVYLPPGYDARTHRYPVLYMHDGQQIFGQVPSQDWRVDETCDSLIRAGIMPPLIVVAIENGDRFLEYTPFTGAPGEGGGDPYVRSIRDVLKPEIDRRFSTRSSPDGTWIAGSSLGGLISVYAAFAYPQTFGRAGGVSGSYSWDGSGQFFDFVGSLAKPPGMRLYVDCGRDNLGSARALRDTVLRLGFQEGVDFEYLEMLNHDHAPRYWALRFPGMIQFLASGNPS